MHIKLLLAPPNPPWIFRPSYGPTPLRSSQELGLSISNSPLGLGSIHKWRLQIIPVFDTPSLISSQIFLIFLGGILTDLVADVFYGRLIF